jgi:hypothetical protein
MKFVYMYENMSGVPIMAEWMMQFIQMNCTRQTSAGIASGTVLIFL